MRIVVTGGAGFIGSHVVDRLLTDGHTVLAVDDLFLGTRKHVEHNLNNPAFAFKETDASNEETIAKIFEEFRPEAVFHFAANSDIQTGAFDVHIELKRTLGTTTAILEAARKTGVKQFVFSSTSAVYGTHPVAVSETTAPLKPESNYGSAKLASEAFISTYSHLYGIKSWIFRFPNVCGPRGTHGVFVNFLRFLKKDPTRITVAYDGTQAKPYIYVLDLVDAIMLGWKNGADAINFFNIGNTPLASVNEILQALLKEKGIEKIEIIYTGKPAWPGDVVTYTFDDSKIRALGYAPRFDSKKAVEQTAYDLVHDPKAVIGIFKDQQ